MRQVSSYKNWTQGILRGSIGGHWRYKWPDKCWCGSRLDHFTHDGKGLQNMDNWLNCWSFKLMTKAGKEHGRFECSLWMHLSEAYKRFKTMSIGELNGKFSWIFSGNKKSRIGDMTGKFDAKVCIVCYKSLHSMLFIWNHIILI